MEIDYQRHEGLISRAVMASANITCIGTGGAAGLCKDLARMGVGALTLIDHDRVSATNPATSGFGAHQVGQFKVEALAAEIKAINPDVRVSTLPIPLQNIGEARITRTLQYSSLVLAMTDSVPAQLDISRRVIPLKRDAIFAAAYANASAVEISGTFADTIARSAGCHRCLLLPRVKKYANGLRATGPLASHVGQASFLNSQLLILATALLHYRSGSKLASAKLAEEFVQSPLLITRIAPEFESRGVFRTLPRENQPFASINYPLNLPDEYVCPDCGSHQSSAA